MPVPRANIDLDEVRYMRIIGGQFRGRKIKRPILQTVRPTKDRIRESIFNMIAEKVPNSKVLDLYAGSGSYGLEAISRGAEEALFVEADRRCYMAIKENIRILEIEKNTEVHIAEVSKYIEKMKGSENKFDLIFCDPPYSMNNNKNILIMINQYDILNHSGLLIIEHPIEEDLPAVEGGLSIIKQKTYKNTSISIYKKT